MNCHPIRTARVDRGMTQGQLATAAKCSTASIARIEAGTAVPSEALRVNLAKALNMPLKELNQLIGQHAKAQAHHRCGERLNAILTSNIPEAVKAKYRPAPKAATTPAPKATSDTRTQADILWEQYHQLACPKAKRKLYLENQGIMKERKYV